MQIAAIIIIIVSLIIAVKIVNAIYNWIMRVFGASFMFFNAKTKVVWYILVAALIAGIIGSIFGII